VIYKILHTLVRVALLPAKGEWQLFRHGQSRILPLSRLALVVHKVKKKKKKKALKFSHHLGFYLTAELFYRKEERGLFLDVYTYASLDRLQVQYKDVVPREVPKKHTVLKKNTYTHTHTIWSGMYTKEGRGGEALPKNN